MGALCYLMMRPQNLLVLAFVAFAQQGHNTVLYVKLVELIQSLSVYTVCSRELWVMDGRMEGCCFHCALASLLPTKCQIK